MRGSGELIASAVYKAARFAPLGEVVWAVALKGTEANGSCSAASARARADSEAPAARGTHRWRSEERGGDLGGRARLSSSDLGGRARLSSTTARACWPEFEVGFSVRRPKRPRRGLEHSGALSMTPGVIG